MAKTTKYDASSIIKLEGLEPVRKRPGMYIGSTDHYGLHHLVWEILDNSMDEAINGFGKVIRITIEKDNVICIEDEGRGVPTDMHSSGKPTIEVVYTELHAGGKFSSESGYKMAGGLHGVGASVVNALSEWMEVTSCYNGKIGFMRFENGGSKVSRLKNLGPTTKTGTKVRFLADKKIFTHVEYSYNTIAERVREAAFLTEGLKLILKDERTGQSAEFCYENGLQAFIEYLHENKTGLSPIVRFSGTANRIGIDVAFQFIDSYRDENTYSFCNKVRTTDGGSHEVGYRTAFTKCFNDYARRNGLLKDKEPNLDGKDVREGLTSIISVAVPEDILQFEGQTKGKLGTPEARTALDSFISEKLSFWLEENKELATLLVRKMVKSYQAREAARAAAQAIREGKKNNKKAEKLISGKLAPAHSSDSRKKELFIVEGDSAGGSAKQGRDSQYQAILPLRGKVLNTEDARMEEITANEELNTLIYTIGAGVGDSFDVESSNYNKIIIMTDADTDGAHIQVLLLTFLYRYMKPLIDANMVYIALSPLYKATKGKETWYAFNDDELNQIREEHGKVEIQRYKGLGEMNAEQLWETTMDPATRTLVQVHIDDNIATDNKFSVLMGRDADVRRNWIEDYVVFTLEDSYHLEDKQ